MSLAAPVLFSTLPCGGNKLIGIATLNAEHTLNALTLAMVEQLYDQLIAWQIDGNIAAVFLQGSGDRAFCAGGDVQQLYESATANPGGPCPYAEQFFEKEYRLDYAIHQYTKPILCWGHGIVMGGGLGLLMGCSHRIVCENTRMAMPEMTIGLYPDVGGSYFLNRTPGRSGLFLALTAAQLNATDALFLGFADLFIEQSHKDQVLHRLQGLAWRGQREQDQKLVDMALAEYSEQSLAALPPANVQPHLDTINVLTNYDRLGDIVAAIGTYASDHPWLQKATAALAHGSPLSACNSYQALQLAKQMSLADVFRFELILSTNIVRHPEFAEGVRALLIDKDRQPQWQYESVHQVPSELLAEMVKAPWARNPLDDLSE